MACSELLEADEWLYGPVHNHRGWIALHAIDARLLDRTRLIDLRTGTAAPDIRARSWNCGGKGARCQATDDAIQRVVAATLASGRRHGGDGLRYAWHGGLCRRGALATPVFCTSC